MGQFRLQTAVYRDVRPLVVCSGNCRCVQGTAGVFRDQQVCSGNRRCVRTSEAQSGVSLHRQGDPGETQRKFIIIYIISS